MALCLVNPLASNKQPNKQNKEKQTSKTSYDLVY